MLFKDRKKALSPILLMASLIVACAMSLWFFCDQLTGADAFIGEAGWATVIIVILGIIALIYILVCYYRSLFLLFGMAMPDGSKPLARFKMLITFDIVLSVYSCGVSGGKAVYLEWASNLTALAIGIVMYVYFRRKGRLFNNCLAAYALFVFSALIFSLCGNGYEAEESVLIFDWGNTLMIMGGVIISVVFIFCARKLYYSQKDLMDKGNGDSSFVFNQ